MANVVTLRRIQKKDIAIIRPLWDKLRLHHYETSVHFKDFYTTFTFEIRTRKLLELNEDDLFLEIAELETGDLIGYCISSISKDCAGELDSIYIEDEFRKRGVGSGLVRDSIEWMKSRACAHIIVGVANGNESALPFYEKFGFLPRMTVLELKD